MEPVQHLQSLFGLFPWKLSSFLCVEVSHRCYLKIPSDSRPQGAERELSREKTSKDTFRRQFITFLFFSIPPESKNMDWSVRILTCWFLHWSKASEKVWPWDLKQESLYSIKQPQRTGKQRLFYSLSFCMVLVISALWCDRRSFIMHILDCLHFNMKEETIHRNEITLKENIIHCLSAFVWSGSKVCLSMKRWSMCLLIDVSYLPVYLTDAWDIYS